MESPPSQSPTNSSDTISLVQRTNERTDGNPNNRSSAPNLKSNCCCALSSLQQQQLQQQQPLPPIKYSYNGRVADVTCSTGGHEPKTNRSSGCCCCWRCCENSQQSRQADRLSRSIRLPLPVIAAAAAVMAATTTTAESAPTYRQQTAHSTVC